MKNKKERTLELYKSIGAEMRLVKTLSKKMASDVSLVLSASDKDKLDKALNIIDDISSKAEDNMFRDYPELGDEYINVFFGSLNSEPKNKIDAEIIKRAQAVAYELFK